MQQVYRESTFSGHLLLGETCWYCKALPLPLTIINFSLIKTGKIGNNTVTELPLCMDIYSLCITMYEHTSPQHLSYKRLWNTYIFEKGLWRGEQRTLLCTSLQTCSPVRTESTESSCYCRQCCCMKICTTANRFCQVYREKNGTCAFQRPHLYTHIANNFPDNNEAALLAWQGCRVRMACMDLSMLFFLRKWAVMFMTSMADATVTSALHIQIVGLGPSGSGLMLKRLLSFLCLISVACTNQIAGWFLLMHELPLLDPTMNLHPLCPCRSTCLNLLVKIIHKNASYLGKFKTQTP